MRPRLWRRPQGLGPPSLCAGLAAGLAAAALLHGASFAGDRTGAHPCREDRDCGGYDRCIAGGCAVPPAVTGRVDDDTPTLEVLGRESSRGRFFVELATDPFAQARGLGRRPAMAPGWGMLFVFAGPVQHAFTMEPMHFALDMVFIAPDGEVVDIVENAAPGVPVVRAARPYRYVLEIDAGAARAGGMQVGDRIQLTGVAPNHLPNHPPGGGPAARRP